MNFPYAGCWGEWDTGSPKLEKLTNGKHTDCSNCHHHKHSIGSFQQQCLLSSAQPNRNSFRIAVRSHIPPEISLCLIVSVNQLHVQLHGSWVLDRRKYFGKCVGGLFVSGGICRNGNGERVYACSGWEQNVVDGLSFALMDAWPPLLPCVFRRIGLGTVPARFWLWELCHLFKIDPSIQPIGPFLIGFNTI